MGNPETKGGQGTEEKQKPGSFGAILEEVEDEVNGLKGVKKLGDELAAAARLGQAMQDVASVAKMTDGIEGWGEPWGKEKIVALREVVYNLRNAQSGEMRRPQRELLQWIERVEQAKLIAPGAVRDATQRKISNR